MAENDAIVLTRVKDAPTSMRFNALRERALGVIQHIAKDTWTDHNLHDPGITVMEAAAYAITELGLRVNLDVRGLIASGAHLRAPNMPGSERVLPCLPVTTEDLHDTLIDHYLVLGATISIDASPEQPVFVSATPPPALTYTPGELVPLSGLFEVMLEFEERELNSNSYALQLTTANGTYTADLSLPYWDEEESQPFLTPQTVANITLMAPGWRALDEPQTFFGRVEVDYGAATNAELWSILQITDTVPNPATEIPLVLQTAVIEVESLAAGGPIGLWAQRALDAQAAVTDVARYVNAWRNLAEEPIRLLASRVQEIAVRAHIEVTGSADLETLLANIYVAIDCAIQPPTVFVDIDTLVASNQSVDDIHRGPLLTHGFLEDPIAADESITRDGQIFTSDVLRIIMAQRGAETPDLVAQENPTGRDIVAVADLTLANFINSREITTGARSCLRLVDVTRYRPRLSVAKSRIIFVRNGIEVPYDEARLQTIYDSLQAAKRGTSGLADPKLTLPPERGEALPIDEYYPFQYDLPRTYGVAPGGLPANAPTERVSLARQFKAYVTILEQLLADTSAQLTAINRFFSPDPNEAGTYFVRPLVDIDGMEHLVAAFTGGSWDAFVADANNAYAQALRGAVEDKQRFLDRRNRMLDHLLSRQGDEAVTLGQELHRWGRQSLEGFGLVGAALDAAIDARRPAVNLRLLFAKARFLAELPELAAARLQSFGDPLQRRPDLTNVDGDGDDFRWTALAAIGITLTTFDDQTPASADFRRTRGTAITRARSALMWAGQPAFYHAQVIAAEPRIVLRESADPASAPLAMSAQVFASVPVANAAIADFANVFAALRIAVSLTPLERRIRHLTNIRDFERHPIVRPLTDHLEAVDAPAGGPPFNKRWNFSSDAGPSGTPLLEGDPVATDAVEVNAEAAALGQLDDALVHLIDEWSYRVVPVGNDFRVEIADPAGTLIARSLSLFTTEAVAESFITSTVARVYDRYAREGFYMVENILLRPRDNTDSLLDIALSETERARDPYSHRLMFVFPSGYARDFSDDSVAAQPVAPHRFRSTEFRRHAERTIRSSTPAHLAPHIYWVDQSLPGTPGVIGNFEDFESRYLDWLRTVLVPGTLPAVVSAARNSLVDALNVIALP